MPDLFDMPTDTPTRFDDHPQPERNGPESVAAALSHVANANSEAESWVAYGRLLDAVGNDHAGTYHPVVLAVLPHLRRVLQHGGPWSQHAAINAIIELCGSFEPESGHETYRGVSLNASVWQESAKLAPLLAPLSERDTVVAASARELLDLLDERSAPLAT